ncbi:MAG: hypothetical protein MUC61_02985 [Amoebophilaceae bacterium]|jgi:hypothetical protein|nr:hypothetical protein [Amoebophilaceae bacterium]
MWISEYIDLLASLIVGITFLFSGVVKLNDPRGFAYKIEEYLHLFASRLATHLRLLIPYTVILSVSIATLEAVLGVALLVHWQRFWTLSALLSLTFFFTCLTLYTATSKRVASCGCFGDALALTPWQSFAKSSVLLVLLIGLYWQEKGERASPNDYYWLAFTLLCSLGMGRRTLRHLPWQDFLPYKIGSDLSQLVRPHLPLRYMYTVKKEGQTIETEHYPQAPGCKLISTRLLNPEDVPTAMHFSIWQGVKDRTQDLLTGCKLLIIAQNSTPIAPRSLQKLHILIRQIQNQKRVQPVLVASSNHGQEVAATLTLPLYTANPLLLRTMLRAPLGLFFLQEGTVVNKFHLNDLRQAQNTLKQLGWSC